MMTSSRNRSHLSFVHLGPLGLRIVNLAGGLAQLIRKFDKLRFDIYIDIFQNVLENGPKRIPVQIMLTWHLCSTVLTDGIMTGCIGE